MPYMLWRVGISAWTNKLFPDSACLVKIFGCSCMQPESMQAPHHGCMLMHVQVLKEVRHCAPAARCEEGGVDLCACFVVRQLHAQGRLRQEHHVKILQEICVGLL